MLQPSTFSEYQDHKKIIEINEPSSGLFGFIAIHNNNLGPAVGGTRMYPYKSKKEALVDVLKLSRAMTYKCAISGIHCGGGKGVIIGDSKTDKSKKLLKAYAQQILKLEGQFYTGEDVGISEKNVQYMLKYSPYFIGKSGLAGDPSPYASLSVLVAIFAAAKAIYGNSNLQNKKIAVKGVGKVGRELVRLLHEEGAKIVIADVNEKAVKKIIDKYPDVEVVDHTQIHSKDVDIYAPCAMGNEFSPTNYKEVKAKIICGGANNQLSDAKVAELFYKSHVLYIPDYIANSGGLINVADELEKDGYNNERVLRRIKNIKNTILRLIGESKDKKINISELADKEAEKIFLRKKTYALS